MCVNICVYVTYVTARYSESMQPFLNVTPHSWRMALMSQIYHQFKRSTSFNIWSSTAQTLIDLDRLRLAKII